MSAATTSAEAIARAEAILADLRWHRVQVSHDGERVRLQEQGHETPGSLLADVRQHERELIDVLRERDLKRWLDPQHRDQPSPGQRQAWLERVVAGMVDALPDPLPPFLQSFVGLIDESCSGRKPLQVAYEVLVTSTVLCRLVYSDEEHERLPRRLRLFVTNRHLDLALMERGWMPGLPYPLPDPDEDTD